MLIRVIDGNPVSLQEHVANGDHERIQVIATDPGGDALEDTASLLDDLRSLFPPPLDHTSRFLDVRQKRSRQLLTPFAFLQAVPRSVDSESKEDASDDDDAL